MEENKQNQDIDFMKEKVKERPLSRKKLIRRTIITASMAVIFGLIACITFLVLEPVFANLLYPEEEPQQVELKEEDIDEEMLPADMILEEETEEETPTTVTQTVVEKVELELSDYQRLYRIMYALVQDISKSMVTVTGVVTDMDWFDNTYENEGQAAGLIVAQNGKELLILTNWKVVDGADSVEVTFSDQAVHTAQMKGHDEDTGLAIVSVLLNELSESTKKAAKTATLGSSNSSVLASPVIAMGRPLGTSTSVVYGMVTSADTYENLADHNVKVLTTDMTGSTNGTGILINLSGQVVGILKPDSKSGKDSTKLLSAYGITDLRRLIEKLSNGQEIAHMGIRGTDVPADVTESKGVPRGAYVTGIEMDSPAMEAGIQSGDVLVRIGTTEISSFGEYQDVMMNLAPDTAITVTVMRQGVGEYREMTMDVILSR
ncbi:MAG: trypsin-like peptidase domain-containing protein [Lachnospiraceae bacterium]|nr:trypsin-like peptidase domain-containing protein [Lachnospiraceae bacterium]